MSSALSPALRFFLGFACFVVIVAGMRSAVDILVPFLLSAFIAILCAPALLWLEARKVPTSIAVILVVLFVIITFGGFSMVVASSINSFAKQVPTYQASLQQETMAITNWLQGHGVEISQQMVRDQINPGFKHFQIP